jgi:hypothetical protein
MRVRQTVGAHPEKCETVFGQDARKKRWSVDLIQSGRSALSGPASAIRAEDVLDWFNPDGNLQWCGNVNTPLTEMVHI